MPVQANLPLASLTVASKDSIVLRIVCNLEDELLGMERSRWDGDEADLAPGWGSERIIVRATLCRAQLPSKTVGINMEST